MLDCLFCIFFRRDCLPARLSGVPAGLGRDQRGLSALSLPPKRLPPGFTCSKGRWSPAGFHLFLLSTSFVTPMLATVPTDFTHIVRACSSFINKQEKTKTKKII